MPLKSEIRNPKSLFLGVDGGQSDTTALIGDETGRILGSGRGGPCNHVKGPEGRPKFINAIGGGIFSPSLVARFYPPPLACGSRTLFLTLGPPQYEDSPTRTLSYST